MLLRDRRIHRTLEKIEGYPFSKRDPREIWVCPSVREWVRHFPCKMT